MDVYDLYRNANWYGTVIGGPLTFILAGAGFLLLSVSSAQLLAATFGALAFFGGFHLAWSFWRLPTRIVLSDEGTVRFESWLRTTEVTVGHIHRIRPGTRLGYLCVDMQEGEITILAQFDRFHQLLWRLRQMNPGIEIRGC
jgi:uncharacterized membrane protein YfcA